MLLILSASSFRKSINSKRGGVDLLDLPRMAHEEFGFRGLLIPTDVLVGADMERLDRVRESADKSACPYLFLVETDVHPIGHPNEDRALASKQRIERVLTAASRLGCSSAGISIAGADTDAAMALAVERLKPLASRAEQLDLNLLIRPSPGLTETPERMSDLIKLVGGFRLGSLPDFEAAAGSGDAHDYLRRLAPYAPVVLASSTEFNAEGLHTPYDLQSCAQALVSIGFDGAVAVEYRGEGANTSGATPGDDSGISEGIMMTRLAIEPTLLGTEE